jgi:ATP-dependent helicase HrpB
MSELPMHPRLSRLLIEASERNCLPRAALWAGLISQRDIVVRAGGKQGAKPGTNAGPPARSKLTDDLPDGPKSDFIVLERAFELARRLDFDPNRCFAMGVVGPACRELEKTFDLYMAAAEDAGLMPRGRVENALSAALSGGPLEPIVECLLLAFTDHLAMRKNPANLAVAVIGNRKGTLDSESVAMQPGVVIALEVRELGSGGAGGVKTVLSMVTEVEPEWLERAFPGPPTRFK